MTHNVPQNDTPDPHPSWVDAALQRRAARIAFTRALHVPRDLDVVTGDCATEKCDHEDGCPTVPVAVCRACHHLAQVADPYYGEAGTTEVRWPCATAAALENEETTP